MSKRGIQVTDLTCVGEILVDFVAPDAEDLENASRFVSAPGGAPANVAVAAARLGARTHFVGVVGDDPFGRVLIHQLQTEGIDVQCVRISSQYTTVAFVAHNAGGIPDFVFHRGADAELSLQDIPLELLTQTKFVYVSSMALLSEPSASATAYAVEVVKEAGGMVAVDPNLRPSQWPSLDAARTALAGLLAAADVLKLNEDEARLLAGESQIENALKVLSSDSRLTIVTMGDQGCLWTWGDEHGHADSPVVLVEDTTGAGDAFMGGLLTELSRGGFVSTKRLPIDVETVRNAIEFACATGAMSCTQTGAMSALPRREQVERLLLQ